MIVKFDKGIESFSVNMHGVRVLFENGKNAICSPKEFMPVMIEKKENHVTGENNLEVRKNRKCQFKY